MFRLTFKRFSLLLETSSQANLTENPPHILAIRHYQNDEKEIQDINFCYVNGKNPINIYPLFEQYVLVSYVHANDTSDNTTFMDRGMVIDWNGNILSIIDFGPSYLFPNSTTWEPNELIVNNIVTRNGFLRLSRVRRTNNFEWKQYGRFNDGSFSLLQNDTFTTDSTDLTNFQVTVLQTLDNGYAVIYSKTLFASTRIYALKLKFNEKTAIKFNLYELTQPNTTFIGLFCSVDYVYVGHLCIASVANNEYGNFHVDTTYPRKDSNNLEINCNKINITFHDPVSFADGNLSIYHISNQGDFLRQIINSKNCINCIAQDNVVTLDVYDSTFNEPGAKYYIQMDNKFVQNSIYDEAILGIDPYMWTFRTANVDISQSSSYAGDIRGVVRLTKSGTQYFQAMSKSERDAFITALLNELTVRIPTEKGRLSSNGHYQLDTTVESQILISFSINKAKNSEKFLSTLVSKYLNQLIENGAYTGISTGTTTIYLDYIYGFQLTQSISDFFEMHKIEFILLIVA
ncbi:hypothetical protein C2G38_2138369 [Gigaspora rosea]|uniref:SbsA Ig-like domain-containing protein n=1 Tax=Gigaspora rosea TaxID=44941 RepID=A0A397VY63_9GLOM|nr:hypothetical protein C2G38_2138369 [Gigaspora rosea]